MLLLLLACASPESDLLSAETGQAPADCPDCASAARSASPPSSSPIPVADAECTTPQAERTVCTALQLDGSGSHSRAPGALSFTWQVHSGPSADAVSSATIEEATDASPTLVVRQPGPYRLLLTVSDRSGATSRADALDLVVADRTSNDPPVAVAGDDQDDVTEVTCVPTAYGSGGYTCPICPAATFTLDAGGSYDPDDEPLTYRWDVVDGPGTLGSRGGSTTTVRIVGQTTTYGGTSSTSTTVRLIAIDCGGERAIDEVTLTQDCTGA